MTYLLKGSLVHQDSNGGKGTLQAGDLQAMRAGRGIVHNETPIEDPITHMSYGLQLWIALPAANLNDEPAYVDVIGKDCPVVSPEEFPGVKIKLITGDSFGVSTPILTRAPVWYLDITLGSNAKLAHIVPPEWNAFAMVLEGTPVIAGKICVPHEVTFFNRDGDMVEMGNGEGEARVLLIAGDRLAGQEVHRYGPFVDVSEQGIRKAISDWRTSKNGFEAWGKGWRGERVHK
jgi:redox-sensitive bicupin YhaK (pirin superfamily)